MARLVQLIDLRAAVRQATDIQSELARFPDAEINGYVNRGIAQLHVKLVAARGQGFQETTTTLSTVISQELYTLPATFLEVVNVFMVIDGARRIIRTYEEMETDGLRTSNVGYDWCKQPFYRLSGDQMSILPTPATVQTINIKYIPSAVVLTTDTSTLDGIDGFEEYVIGYAGQLVSTKQGDDGRMAMMMQQQQQALANILAIQKARNAAEAPRMVDVKGGDWWSNRRRMGRYGRGSL